MQDFTTQQIRAIVGVSGDGFPDYANTIRFNHWLEEVKREAREEGYDRAVGYLAEDYADDDSVNVRNLELSNPYRKGH